MPARCVSVSFGVRVARLDNCVAPTPQVHTSNSKDGAEKAGYVYGSGIGAKKGDNDKQLAKKRQVRVVTECVVPRLFCRLTRMPSVFVRC